MVVFAGNLANAQVRTENYFAKKWLLDINIPIGMTFQSPTISYVPKFQNVINSQFNNLKLSPATNTGLDLEFGCYFGDYKRFGIGTGIIYQASASVLSLDNYHVEYKSTDDDNNIFRQLVSSTGTINENLTNYSINIPIVFKVKELLTKKIGFSADAGILYNYSSVTNYSSNASFDYEAIYSYILKADGEYSHVYDNQSTPSVNDWLITKQQFNSHNTGSNRDITTYFDSLRLEGYHVGLGIKPEQNSGSITFPGGSLGFIIRPAFNIKIHERTFFYLGGYLSYQFINKGSDKYFKLTDNVGINYSSLLNTITKINNFSYGCNVGIRVFLGHSSIYIEQRD